MHTWLFHYQLLDRTAACWRQNVSPQLWYLQVTYFHDIPVILRNDFQCQFNLTLRSSCLSLDYSTVHKRYRPVLQLPPPLTAEGASDHLYVPAALSPRPHRIGRVDARARLDLLEKKNILALQEREQQPFRCPAHGLVTVSTEICSS